MDPLSAFTVAIESYLADSAYIGDVLGANVKKKIDAFVTSRSTKEPDVFGESDLPRITLIPQGGPANVNIASNLATFDLSYEVGIRSGDKRFSYDLFPLTFALFRTITMAVRAEDSPLFELEWQGYKFVRDLALSDMKPGFSSTTDDKRGIDGTVTVCTLTAYLEFPQTLLIA